LWSTPLPNHHIWYEIAIYATTPAGSTDGAITGSHAGSFDAFVVRYK
jgi:hypothetical protein